MNRPRKMQQWLALFVLVSLLLAGCGAGAPEADNTGGQSSGGSDAPETVKIGYVNPMSGGASHLGQNGLLGAQLALQQMEQSGELGNVKVELVVEDSKCSPVDAASGVQKVIEQDQVAAIIGPACSSAVLASLSVLDQYQVPALAWIASAYKVTEQGSKNIFRMIPNERMQASQLVDYVVNQMNAKRVAFVVEQTDAGFGAREAWKLRLEELGADVEVVEDLQINQQATDFTPIVTRLQAAQPDAVLTLLLLTQGVQFVKALEERKVDIPIVHTVAWAYPLFEERAGSAAEGVIRQVFYLPTTDDPLGQKFAEAFEKANNKSADFNSALTYDSMRLVGHAIKEGARTPEQFREAFASANMEGVTGPIAFEENGQVKLQPGKILFIRTESGKAVLIGTNE